MLPNAKQPTLKFWTFFCFVRVGIFGKSPRSQLQDNLSGYIESITFAPDPGNTVSCPSDTEDLNERGVLEWPATSEFGVVTATCKFIHFHLLCLLQN